MILKDISTQQATLALKVTVVFLNFVNHKMINMLCKITIKNVQSIKRKGSTALER